MLYATVSYRGLTVGCGCRCVVVIGVCVCVCVAELLCLTLSGVGVGVSCFVFDSVWCLCLCLCVFAWSWSMVLLMFLFVFYVFFFFFATAFPFPPRVVGKEHPVAALWCDLLACCWLRMWIFLRTVLVTASVQWPASTAFGMPLSFIIWVSLRYWLEGNHTNARPASPSSRHHFLMYLLTDFELIMNHAASVFAVTCLASNFQSAHRY